MLQNLIISILHLLLYYHLLIKHPRAYFPVNVEGALLDWFSNWTGMSVDDRNVNFPLSYWSSQLFHLRAPLSTDVPILLLNQSVGEVGGGCLFLNWRRNLPLAIHFSLTVLLKKVNDIKTGIRYQTLNLWV